MLNSPCLFAAVFRAPTATWNDARQWPLQVLTQKLHAPAGIYTCSCLSWEFQIHVFMMKTVQSSRFKRTVTKEDGQERTVIGSPVSECYLVWAHAFSSCCAPSHFCTQNNLKGCGPIDLQVWYGLSKRSESSSLDACWSVGCSSSSYW